jgi:hypothetical protein
MTRQAGKEQRVTDGPQDDDRAGSGEGAASAMARMRSQRERRHARQQGPQQGEPGDDIDVQQQ